MKGWKTITFNVLTMIVFIAGKYADMWNINTEVVAYISMIGNFILRFLTTTPVGGSSESN